MLTVSELFAKLGRSQITDALGHGPQVLSRAAVTGTMPPSWYPGIRDMCADKGIPCPEHLFRWADRPDDKRDSAA